MYHAVIILFKYSLEKPKTHVNVIVIMSYIYICLSICRFVLKGNIYNAKIVLIVCPVQIKNAFVLNLVCFLLYFDDTYM